MTALAIPSMDLLDFDVHAREGWDLFECSASGHDSFELQRDDDAGLLPDDTAAWRLVTTAAAAGSVPHQRALTFLAHAAPGEYALITNPDWEHHPRCLHVYHWTQRNEECGTPMYFNGKAWICPWDNH